MTVRHAGRTCRLACPAAEATINVRLEGGVVEREGALERRSHKQHAAARTVILVLEREIRRTALEAEPAVYAGVDAGSHLGERGSWQRAGCLTRWPRGNRALVDEYPRADAVHVPVTEERYRIRGFDSRTAVKDMFYTFVRERGKWKIASDTDLYPITLYSARGLWDFGPLSVRQSGNLLVIAQACRRCPQAPAGSISLIREALARVDSVWRKPWPHKIVVLVPRSSPELKKMIQATFNVNNFVAFTYSTIDAEHSFDYTGQRIILNPRAFFGNCPSELCIADRAPRAGKQ